MSKQLRIWLFVLLSTLLTSTSLLAEGVITLTTSKAVGEEIRLSIEANGSVSITGVRESALTDGSSKYYTLTSQTITIRGDVTELYCGVDWNNNQLTSLDVSDCTSLTKLGCSNNYLTSLDVSGCSQLNYLNCSENLIKEEAMSQLVASLPTCKGASGTFVVVSGSLDEGNYCSKANVASARAKNWISLKYRRAMASVPYEGEDSNLQVGSGVITMTTSKAVGSTITLAIKADGGVTIEGAKTPLQPDGHIAYYTLTSQTVTIRGDVTELDCSANYNYLTSLEASGCTALTTLDCSRSELTSLNVSGCTALTTLDCSRSELTSLNVSGCTALTTLDCSNNPLTSINLSGCESLKSFSWTDGKLTSLDVSGCTALTELNCRGNQLTSLDMSKNTALTKLYCGGNQLTSLVLSGCTALKQLYCTSNKLTHLNVSGCTALTKLDCKDNQLASLDVSGCTALTELQCSNNPLTSINLSGCQSLKSFSWPDGKLTHLNVSGCTVLTGLNCSSNQLTTLDVSGCTALTTLYCGSNRLTSLDVSSCTALTELKCTWNRLTSLDVSKCPSLEKLYCSSNQLTSLDVSKNSSLGRLECQRNQLTSLNISSNTPVAYLDCENNQLTSLDLSRNTFLTELLCANNHLTSLDLTGCTSLKTFTSPSGLTSLNLSGCTGLTELYCPEDNSLTSLNILACINLEKIGCVNSGLDGKAMSQVISDLPDRNGKSQGTIKMRSEYARSDKTFAYQYDVEVAKKKNWKVYYPRPEYNKYGTMIFISTDYIGAPNPICSVTKSVEGKGSLSITGADNLDVVVYGTRLSISATPAPKYELVSLTANGVDISSTKSFVVKDTVTIKAVFGGHPFNVVLEQEGEGDLSVTGVDNLDEVPYGTELTIIANPKKGYELTSLIANGINITDTKKVTVRGDLTIKATFTKKAFAVTFAKEGDGTVTAAGATSLDAVAYGTELTIVATPAAGYELTALTANGRDIFATKKVVVTENMTIKATFAKKSFAVSLTKEGEGTITATGATSLNAVAYGTELTINATPAEGYELVSITANGTDITATKKIVVTDNLTVKATFAKKSFAVSLTKEGEGMISATGASNLNSVAYGTELTIVATPAEGYELVSITAGGTNITASRKVVVTGNLTVKATFTKKSFAVSLTKEGEGTISATGASNLNSVAYGTELTIVATPAEGYELTALTANGTDILATKKIVVTDNMTVKATFTKKNFAVSLTKEGEGTISATGASSLNAVAYGTELTINATPAKGYELTALTANGTDILTTKKIVVKDNMTVKATFTKKAFAVSLTKEGEGTITATGASNLNAVAYGTELTISATPAEGYELTALTANGTDILATKKVVVTDNMTVKATFAKKSFAVSLTKEGEGTITATGASSLNAVAYGTELTINATPAEGYELTALTANGTDILATKKIVVEGNLTVKATFTKKTFAVTLTSNEHGKISIVEPVDLDAVPYGTTLTVKATGKNAQCELTALTANGVDILATKSFVVKGATEVKATFVDHTGVETTVTQQTQLYPNPATDYVIVEGVAPASEVTLHSMTGDRLYAGRADSRGVLQIDLTPYADGVYLVCVAGETYRVVVKR